MDKAHSLSDLKEPLLKLYPELKQKYRIARLGIFGSYMRNEQREDRDLLGIKVDLVIEDALKPNIKERVLKEVQFR